MKKSFKIAGWVIVPPQNVDGAQYRRVYSMVQEYGPAMLAGKIEAANWWADKAAATARAFGWAVN